MSLVILPRQTEAMKRSSRSKRVDRRQGRGEAQAQPVVKGVIAVAESGAGRHADAGVHQKVFGECHAVAYAVDPDEGIKGRLGPRQRQARDRRDALLTRSRAAR